MSAFLLYQTALRDTVENEVLALTNGKFNGKRKKGRAKRTVKKSTKPVKTVAVPVRKEVKSELLDQGKLTCSSGVTSHPTANQHPLETSRDQIVTAREITTANHNGEENGRAEVEREEFDCPPQAFVDNVACVGNLPVANESLKSVESLKDSNRCCEEKESPPKPALQPSNIKRKVTQDKQSKKKTKLNKEITPAPGTNTRFETKVVRKKVLVVEKRVEDMGKRRDMSDPSNGGGDGREEAQRLFEWLIHPVHTDQFFKELWEAKPLLIKRHNTKYNVGWFSSEEFSNIIRDHPVQFGTHLDLTTFKNGQRQTHNLPGRATPDLVWKHYKEGGSIRMLNPQTYSKSVWLLLNTLQDFFRSTMGANVYLTPPGTQGFAPHYDDIEAFLIQLEGKKHWRLYAPREPHEALPQHSSPNFSQDDLGKPILDTVLEAGDVLYFPRGTIHQGNCLPDSHSLHLTISTYQSNTWGDLLERLLPKALAVAREEDKEFRQGLPRDYLDYTGVSHSDSDLPSRAEFMRKIDQLMKRLASFAPVDSAADDLGSRLLHDALPPHPNRGSISQHSSSASCSNGVTLPGVSVDCSSRVRLTSPYCARLMVHEECVSLQHSCSNSRLIHQIEPQEIDYPQDYGPALELLVNSYPQFTEVSTLPLPAKSSVTLVQELVDQNILRVECSEAASPPVLVKMRGKQKNINNKGGLSNSADDIPVKLRNRPISEGRPVSGVQSICDNERKCRTLEPARMREKAADKRRSYRRSGIDTSSATLTEV